MVLTKAQLLICLALTANVGYAVPAVGDQARHVPDRNDVQATSTDTAGDIPEVVSGLPGGLRAPKTALIPDTVSESGASGTHSTAMGFGTKASGYVSTAMGQDTKASGSVSTAMGVGSTASGRASTVMGSFTKASGSISTAMGIQTEATGTSSTAMGYCTKATGKFSSAMGMESEATGTASTAIGLATKASTQSELVVGQCNVVDQNSKSGADKWRTEDAVLRVGVGTAEVPTGVLALDLKVKCKTKVDALRVLKDGKVFLPKTFSETKDVATALTELKAANADTDRQVVVYSTLIYRHTTEITKLKKELKAATDKLEATTTKIDELKTIVESLSKKTCTCGGDAAPTPAPTSTNSVITCTDYQQCLVACTKTTDLDMTTDLEQCTDKCKRACKKDCDTGGFDDGLLKCEGPRLVTIDTKLVQVTINKALGGWGGKCRCPDGGVYYAADNGDRCKTLACTGGTKVDCNQYDDKKWRHKKVTCKAS